ncbi:MAG: DUF481 domain-containing protein [Candidatus Abyssobacteria bacterium SURF_17]|uniref:DUF481 domain-containing protein n=1 Tax=Candidatus Abyssobacteria bacterium SURF_17 TaxID=2093361 RepID=A0A419EQA7_9BACT|nr:MAG: DUF481 domain-containing protein [Candidatus Abyssubacteria bacterium SURF_17]
MRKLCGLFFLFVVATMPTIVFADHIALANGDSISGEIIHISDGQIQVVTEYAGEIRIDFSKATDLTTETSGRVTMKNGDAITGRLLSVSEEDMVIASVILGELRVPRESFVSFELLEKSVSVQAEAEAVPVSTREAAADHEVTRQSVEDEMVEAKAPELPADLWSGSFAVGAQLQRGNTDTMDVHIESSATRTVPREELRLKFYADYGETEGNTDTNRIFGEGKLKVFLSEPRYVFGLTNMEYDEMENLDLRAQAFGGAGQIFLKTGRTQFLGEIGAGLTGEFFDNDGDEETVEPSGWLNAEWRQKVGARAEFFQGLTLYPSLGSFGDYRVRSESALTTPISDHWAVKLSVIDDYDSDPESEDVRKNDFRLISSLEYKF